MSLKYEERTQEGVFQRYMHLPQGPKVQAEYIWIGGNGKLRSKCKTVPRKPKSVSDLPDWNFDGSSTNQAPGDNSEVWLVPVKFVPDPFRGGDNILVLCECYDPSNASKGEKMEPIPSNKRHNALKLFNSDKIKNEHPWYGIEQEYTMFDFNGKRPLGWPQHGYPGPQGPYYCSIGAGRAFGRYIVEAHYRACLYAGINISGINGEVMPGQWEYQVGPCEGIDSGDQLWLSRYILARVAEDFNVVVSFNPKPIKGDWNGAGCHTNFSTKSMRNDGGFKKIIEGCERLRIKHVEHMKLYGLGNENRLTGLHETQDHKTFTYGVADRGSSIRIPRFTEINGKGYLEDRRPAANIDPYEVTAKIVQTVLDENIKVNIPDKILSRQEQDERNKQDSHLFIID